MDLLHAFCKTYVSNTLAAGGSQHHFSPSDPKAEQVGRVYYRVFEGGTFTYSLLFSNTIDSTFADGQHSHQGYECDNWEITHLVIGVADHCDERTAGKLHSVQQITIGGAASYTVQPGEIFATDPLTIAAESGQYLCIEIGFRGNDIPNHEESMIPSFVREGDAWINSRRLPFPSMIGCDRPIKKKIAYLGDSITQGIGVPFGEYTFWNALVSERLGHHNAYWNLGLGFGRAMDAAADGTWLAKAKQNDAVIVCYGVNDLGRGRSAEQILADLRTILDKLHEVGCRVLLQTVPPFDYSEQVRVKWETVNRGILGDLSKHADAVFDVVPVLGQDAAHPHCAKYGGHPNADGSCAWADALYPVLADFLGKSH
ncbi:MAG: SGNH/GDSL hydrolase family protein [Clostridia bacterium]|nr:SGNH/GDSL hydrolase family protein [Clostridia bacterium]